MINPNIKRMLAELKHEFHEIYEVPYKGLYVIISDSRGKTYEDEQNNFSEREIDEVNIVYQGDEITIYPNLFGEHKIGKCEIHAGSLKYESVDVLTQAVAIVCGNLKNIW